MRQLQNDFFFKRKSNMEMQPHSKMRSFTPRCEIPHQSSRQKKRREGKCPPPYEKPCWTEPFQTYDFLSFKTALLGHFKGEQTNILVFFSKFLKFTEHYMEKPRLSPRFFKAAYLPHAFSFSESSEYKEIFFLPLI